MNIPAIINVTIGLFFIYLLFSLFVSELQEFLSTYLFDWRAANLSQSIEVILGKPLTEKFYEHPLIKSLQGYKQQIKKNAKGPSYIPHDIFALVLISVILEESQLRQPLAALTIDNFITALESDNIHTVLDTDRLKLLQTLAQQAKTKASGSSDLDTLEKTLISWFEQSMIRASGVYKRRVKIITLILGLLLAVTLNIDTLNIANRLFQEPVLQENLIQQIDQMFTEEDSANFITCLQSDRPLPETCQSLIEQTLLTQLLYDFSSLPLGWNTSNLDKQFGLSNLTPEFILKIQPSRFLQTLFGWSLTAIALSMGSSFWFDVLNKLINVRNTGNKPSQ